MSTYVLDASAVLRFTDKEAGHGRVRDLFVLGAKSQADLVISAVNWGEIVSALLKRAGTHSAAAGTLVANLAALPLTIVAVGQLEAEAAADFKHQYHVPFADSFAGALALACSSQSRKKDATLVTADFDFKAVPPGVMKIEFLPVK